MAAGGGGRGLPEGMRRVQRGAGARRRAIGRVENGSLRGREAIGRVENGTFPGREALGRLAEATCRPWAPRRSSQKASRRSGGASGALGERPHGVVSPQAPMPRDRPSLSYPLGLPRLILLHPRPRELNCS